MGVFDIYSHFDNRNPSRNTPSPYNRQPAPHSERPNMPATAQTERQMQKEAPRQNPNQLKRRTMPLQIAKSQQRPANQGINCGQGTSSNYKNTAGKSKDTASKSNFLQFLLPSSLYDSKSKKLFGFLSAEDLLLIALIFLFLEKEDNDNLLMVLALGYILLSDYIDLPEIVF